ncbi:MAG: adenylate/guanylate cyclase domain-containing protein [Spirochaetia bacterium]|nr:adenylate/guanylate cyclase domain-containing protein [Spirochaetia bacterium]
MDFCCALPRATAPEIVCLARIRLIRSPMAYLKQIFNRLIQSGLDRALSDERKFIETSNILAVLFFFINIGTLPGLAHFLPESAYLILVQAGVSALWPLVVLFNRFAKFSLARFLFGICTIVHISLLMAFSGSAAGAQFLILAGSNLPFFIYPPRYRRWMYLHAGLSLATAVFWVVYPSVFGNFVEPTGLYLYFLQGLVVFGIIYVVFFSAFYHYNVQRQAELALQAEREKSERLLLNILPEPIAARLKLGDRRIAEDFESATVLFADLANFTKQSAISNAAQIVEMLDGIFSEFDLLAEKHGLEKIKTIGDAYMVAGGVPVRRDNHAEDIARMALGMQQLAKEKPEMFQGMQIRIGIHTGPLVAGVIGRHKFIYDLWGDSVNTASRMESHGIVGEIQISQSVRDALGSRFKCEDRGSVDVKGKGSMQVYLLKGEM